MADSRFPNTPDPNSEDENEIIDLIDEDGVTSPFEHLATLEFEGETFLVLTPADQETDPDSDEDMEIVIMQIQQDEQGEDIYVRPEEDLEDRVFEYFLSMIDEMGEDD